MSDNTTNETVGLKILGVIDSLAKNEEKKDIQRRIYEAEMNILAAREHVENCRKLKDELKVKMEAANKAYEDYLTELESDYFEADQAPLSDQKKLADLNAAYERAKYLYFQAAWQYEGSKEPNNRVIGALEILDQALKTLSNLKREATPKEELKKQEVEIEQSNREKEMLIAQKLERRRAFMTTGEAPKQSKRPNAQQKQPVKKLNVKKLEGGAVAGLFGQRAAGQNPPPQSPSMDSHVKVPTQVDSHVVDPKKPPPLPPRDTQLDSHVKDTNRARTLPPTPTPAPTKTPSQPTNAETFFIRNDNPPPPVPPREHGPQPTPESIYKYKIVNQFIKELSSVTGDGLKDQILKKQKKPIKFNHQTNDLLTMTQAIIDTLNHDNHMKADEKAEILCGLLLNVRQQLATDKKSPITPFINDIIKYLEPTGYLENTNQMPLMGFMERTVRKMDPPAFEKFLQAAQQVPKRDKPQTHLFHTVKQAKTEIPESMQKHETGIKLFNQSIWAYLEPENPDSKMQSSIRKRYEQMGGSSHKSDSVREAQIHFLQQTLNELYLDNNYSGLEKSTILAGVLENIQTQLERDKRSSKLLKVVNELYQQLPDECKKSHNGLLAANMFVHEHKVGQNHRKGLDAFETTHAKMILKPRRKP